MTEEERTTLRRKGVSAVTSLSEAPFIAGVVIGVILIGFAVIQGLRTGTALFSMLAIIVLLLGGVTVCLVKLFQIKKRCQALLHQSRKATAKVVDLWEITSKGRKYHDGITFVFTAVLPSGENREIIGLATMSSACFKIGDNVPVWYLPDEPTVFTRDVNALQTDLYDNSYT